MVPLHAATLNASLNKHPGFNLSERLLTLTLSTRLLLHAQKRFKYYKLLDDRQMLISQSW